MSNKVTWGIFIGIFGVIFLAVIGFNIVVLGMFIGAVIVASILNSISNDQKMPNKTKDIITIIGVLFGLVLMYFSLKYNTKFGMLIGTGTALYALYLLLKREKSDKIKYSASAIGIICAIFGIFYIFGIITSPMLGFYHPVSKNLQYITPEQQKGLATSAYVGYITLGEKSYKYYADEKILESGVAGIKYHAPFFSGTKFNINTIKQKLEENGFNTTNIGSETWYEEGSETDIKYTYSSVSGQKGNILTYITVADSDDVAISSGLIDKAEEVSSIGLSDKGGTLLSPKSSEAKLQGDETIKLVAPLAGTIYAIKYPNNNYFTGSPKAKINQDAMNSYKKAESNQTYSRTDMPLYWIHGPRWYSTVPVPVPIPYPKGTRVKYPRGTGYTIRGAGGPGVK
ncbi:MAG TPA: hypothetical protein EYP22_07655 [Methanosarcinales archaeon]|nr:hypothetical protein [Methanosarcinales archaeon]